MKIKKKNKTKIDKAMMKVPRRVSSYYAINGKSLRLASGRLATKNYVYVS
jgi:hypothetical protein